MKELGVGSHVQCQDLYGFDDDSLAFIPGHTVAVLFLYPWTQKVQLKL